VLSRSLATAGHFPSIDVLESISRVTPAITTREQRDASSEMRRLLAAYRDAKDLIEIGAYVPGTNPTVDRAVALREAMDSFLRQDMHESTPASDAWDALVRLVGGGTS
jgi:flagellum-specific ATP synthase